MGRILLLCFIHGFKGGDNTFHEFPRHLEETVRNNLPDDTVASVVYPKYETKGELEQSTSALLEWLRERVMDLRKEHLNKVWPPNDREVGVILVAHSMGGFVASDTLFRILDEHRHNSERSGKDIFPLIQGILAFDTPYNGLARSMFVYGAFSNYQKVSNVFNVMTALSAAAPAGLARLAASTASSTSSSASRRAASSLATSRASNPAWKKAWQSVAVRTGTVGVIAAGGVAAYMHRREILDSVRSMAGLKKEHVVQGYQSGVDALGQGLAYINQGNVGESFAWLSDHFTFVGALLKQKELSRRLERLAALKGVGVRDMYVSLGENGYWSGGYFVPERTFCAVPGKGEEGAGLFSRHVVGEATDEIVAHLNMFRADRNKDYERMTNEAARLVIGWFRDEEEIWDDPRFAGPAERESEETERLAKAVDRDEDVVVVEEGSGGVKEKVVGGEGGGKEKGENGAAAVPDESPIDIAAAASLIPIPDDDENLDAEALAAGESGSSAEKTKQAYMRHLFGIAQESGSNLWSLLPNKIPTVTEVSSKVSTMPGMASLPTRVSLPSMPSMSGMSVSIPGGISMFGRKANNASDGEGKGQTDETEKSEAAPAEAKSDVTPKGEDKVGEGKSWGGSGGTD
ncbi:hypothetical protein B0T17DRAFT_485446 [Bombardia bombarda]|uniref:DUF676 domain-containing protein n=1 Tax=Bombardia bombarda TaxID=252184 RepID=A0AA40CG27_9PEZI|nr:hypothetical protein B0T17DRAFT_485446 [Bombardia bombarda]